MFEKESSYLQGNEEKVLEALDVIRQIGPDYVERVNEVFVDKRKREINSTATTIIAECLVEAGIYPRYKSRRSTNLLDEALRSLIKTQGGVIEKLSEIITINVQPKWIRGIESKVRLKYRRENFWDIFDSSSIESPISGYGKKLTSKSSRPPSSAAD